MFQMLLVSSSIRPIKPHQIFGQAIQQRVQKNVARKQVVESVGASSSDSSPLIKGNQPWSLMGRVITEDQIEVTVKQQLQLIANKLVGGAYNSKKHLQTVQKLQELLLILPEIESKLGRMEQNLLNAIINDQTGVVQKMIYLKNRLPELDVNSVVLNCPQILLQSNFIGVPGNLDKLERRFENRSDIVGLVQQQPLILFEDVDVLTEKLQRVRGGSKKEALSRLCKNPNIMLMVQSGDKQLGPPAEVVQQD